MNTTTFSRSYLQSLPEKRKQNHIQAIIQEFVQTVQNSASLGKTSCIFSRDEKRGGCYSHPPPPDISNDDIIKALQEKFPDCSVRYEENWVETTPNTKTLTKGILVDWS